MCVFLFERCHNELTADVSGAGRAVLHGAGVGPFLSVGCSLTVPALWGEDRAALAHVELMYCMREYV